MEVGTWYAIGYPLGGEERLPVIGSRSGPDPVSAMAAAARRSLPGLIVHVGRTTHDAPN